MQFVNLCIHISIQLYCQFTLLYSESRVRIYHRSDKWFPNWYVFERFPPRVDRPLLCQLLSETETQCKPQNLSISGIIIDLALRFSRTVQDHKLVVHLKYLFNSSRVLMLCFGHNSNESSQKLHVTNWTVFSGADLKIKPPYRSPTAVEQ